MFSNISILTGVIFDVELFVQIIINFLLGALSIFNEVFFTNSVKLCGFKFEHFSIYFSSDFTFCETVYQFSKAIKFFYVLEIPQFFQCTKIYETMENVRIVSFYRICLLEAIITMRLLILKILCGNEISVSIFHFLCKVMVSVYYSVNLPFLLSKKVLSCSLLFIKFLILYTLILIILFLRFLFYVTVLYLLSVLLACNMSRLGSAFDINVSCVVNDDFNNFRSFLIFYNNSVHVYVHVNVGNYLNHKFYDHNFQSKPESNSNNFKPEILFSVFSLTFYHVISKHNREIMIKIFEFLILISVLNVMKYFIHTEVHDGIKTCSQSRFFTYGSINICDNVETSRFYSDLVFSSISKLQYRNFNSYFNLLLFLSGDISLNPGPLHNGQLQPQNE